MRTRLRLTAPSTIEAELTINATIGEFRALIIAVQDLEGKAGTSKYELNKFMEPIHEAVSKAENEIHIWTENQTKEYDAKT
jgi:hypothetical protein